MIDIASLWFILAIIYSLFISKKNEALFVFISSFLIVLSAGILMITRISFIPLNYKFEICQFACVAVRILHFILMASLIYYILNVFFSTIQNNVKDLELKSGDLTNLNIALKNEMIERKAMKQKMMDAVIQTEEKERKRLARDLHDGLGPVLSAVNLFFQAYIDAAGSENKQEIEYKLKEIIGDAIKDVSRISHNISPNILENYGLITALENFVGNIRVSEKVQFNLNFCEMSHLDIREELIIYRAITELINNTLRHSGASQISLKIQIENHLLHVYYEDNGKGFTIDEKLRSNSGMGMNNIRNRINSLNGEIIFSSSENKGMKAHLIIPSVIRNENELN
ncbi:MAG: sensor histidine kinase [Ignavibacteriaceae bacterium]